MAAPRKPQGLLAGGAILFAGNLFGAGCNALFHVVTGRGLPDAEYGALVSMLGVILLFATPLGAVQNTLAHFVARFAGGGRRDAVGAFFRRVAVRLALPGFAAAALAAAFARPLAAFWGPPVTPGLVVLAGTVLGMSFLQPAVNGLLQGLERYVALAVVPQAWGATRLALAAAFLASGLATAGWCLVAQGAGVVATLLIAAAVLRLFPDAPQAEKPAGATTANCQEKTEEGGVAVRFLAWNLLALLALSALMNADAPLSKHFLPPDAAGVFAKAATIARTAVFLPSPLVAVLFAKISARHPSENPRRLLFQTVAAMGAFLAAVLAGDLIFPALPWVVLYGAVPETAEGLVLSPKALTFALLAAQTPLALSNALVNYDLARRRRLGGACLLAAAAAYLAAAAGLLSRGAPAEAIAPTLLVCNLAALAALVFAVRRGGEAEV